MAPAYDRLRQHLRETAALGSSLALLGWDQETMMPAQAAPSRAEELELLSRLYHERATADRLGELLAACEADDALRADPTAAANLREIRRDFDRARKLPAEFVGEFSRTTSQSLEVWKHARSESDFPHFAPWLEKIVDLNRRKAAYLGVPEGGEPYDALLDEYEPGMTAARIESIFAPLRDALVPMIEAVAGADAPDNAPNRVEIAVERQREFHVEVLRAIGFDLAGGRLDLSTHPFSSGIAPGDTRITTRFTPAGFAEALSSTMHEAGHGMYEQGLPKHEHWGQPLAEPLGLAVHESQSRLWENHVGRSRAFWRWLQPRVREAFGDAFGSFDAEAMYRAANIVRPHLIRVESDEATYNLHVMLRFDLERAMLRGELAPADLPAAWNERVRNDLGLDVPDDARGCLQDIHWSMGSIGYFPTYTLGTLYAAQLWATIERDLPGVEEGLANGEFAPVLEWLRANVHGRGRRTPADELCRELTGGPLDHRPLIAYLQRKLGEIYSIETFAGS